MTSTATMPSARAPLEDLKQYEKIIRLRDDIVAGKHPRLKPPKQKSASVSRPGQAGTASPSSDSAARTSSLNGNKVNNSSSFQTTSQHTVLKAAVKAKAMPAIDPVLLEKSDDLKNAELRLKRQAIEKRLREEVEQRRSKMHASEDTSELDLSEVLIKALQRVQAALPPPQPEEGRGANANSSPASDSFDDNTFYSSQDNTPSSKQSNQQQTDNDDVDMMDDYEPSMPPEPSGPAPTQPTAAERPSGTQNSFLPFMSGALSGLTSLQPSHASAVRETLAGPSSADVSRSHSDSNGTDQNADKRRRDKGGLQPPFELRERPLVRSHDLSPVAPQPAHISTLTTAARDQPVISEQTAPVAVAQRAPAQVTALKRVEAAGPNTSPDSSPQTNNNKKKNKKKKRKAERQAVEPISPFIKAEPRSPSPNLTAPTYERPSKRQRQNTSRPVVVPMQDLTYDDARYDPAQPTVQSERYPSGQYREERYTVAYEGPSRRPTQPAPPVETSRFERDFVEERRPPSRIIRQPRSPGSYVQYTEAPPPRPIVQSAQTYYREYPPEGRMSVRPDYTQDRDRSPMMGPPRAAPTRTVYIDQHGREYLEPLRTAVIHQPVAPSIRHSGDPEVIYERTVHRAVSRRPEAYDDGVVITRRPASPSSSYPPPRRVITQPEFAPSTEYRPSYPQREYSVRPAPVEEYIPSRPQLERRFEEAPPLRDYLTRPTTVRPTESVRYEIPADYTRVQSVRPDMQFREFSGGRGGGGGSHISSEAVLSGRISDLARSGGTGPPEALYVRSGGTGPLPPPVDDGRYYNPSGNSSRPHIRSGDEIAFIEAPRGPTQEIVYADDVRREVYR